MVVLFHAEFTFVPSGFVGVDIFFVISGYLIMGSLIRQTAAGAFDLKDFWARRVRRLIPAATIVNLSILIVGWLIYPTDQLDLVSRDAIAAASYLANWNYLVNQVSYWDITLVSPFLHYWSLSVEEQFYIIFPVSAAFVLYLSRSGGWRITVRRLLVGLGFISSLSLIGLLTATAYESNLYFNTLFRFWEFGLGGLSAFIVLQPRKSYQIFKLALLFTMAAFSCIPSNFQYPGVLTLIPVGLAAIYLSLPDLDQAVRDKIGFNPLERLGDISYSVYLWHWPIILYFTYFVFGLDANIKIFSFSNQMAIVLFALFSGWFSYKYFEEPFRKKPISETNRNNWIAFGAVALAVSVAASLITPFINLPKLAATPKVTVNRNLDPELHTNAGDLQLLIDTIARPDLTPAKSLNFLKPPLDQLLRSKASLYADNCHLESGESNPQTDCIFGDVASDRVIYLVGDSHAANWFPGLEIAARKNGFKLVARTKSSCGLFEIKLAGDEVETTSDCRTYRSKVISELKSTKPVAVIVAQLYNNPGTEINSNSERDEVNAEYKAALQKQISQNNLADLPLILVADVPQLSFEPSRCLATHSPSECQSAHLSYLAPANFLIDISTEYRAYKYVNLNDFICRGISCSATNQDFIIFRDRHHLSDAFSESLSYVWAEVLADL